jgi:anthranilate/para-aminobenzoate synthase component I
VFAASPAAVSLIALDLAPEPALVFDAGRPGAALFEGWSDEGSWRLLLPWPIETRALPWGEAARWKALLDEIERDVIGRQKAEAYAPFLGGWVGFLSYEALASEEEVRSRAQRPAEPAAFFARHEAGVAVSPKGEAFLFAPTEQLEHYHRLLDAPGGEAKTTEKDQGAIVDSLGDGAHAAAVEAIRTAIAAGDVYQVNLTRSFTAAARGSAGDLYMALTGSRPPRCSAFLQGDGWAIVSASPELLLRFDRATGVAESRPIKGTVRRSGDDAAERAALLASGKDAAEHLMIVDVVRNDFGKLAPPGAVSVSEFRAVRTLEHVHHLESTVRAEGLHGRSVVEILAALAPAASITGAPKRAAVRMIRELEPVPRGVYCGSIGLIDERRAQFSVAIRTAVATGSEVRFHAGGGIVWDSEAAAEDEESRDKAAAFLRYHGVAR